MYIVALLMTTDVSLYFFDCVLCRFCHCLESEGLVEAFLSSRSGGQSTLWDGPRWLSFDPCLLIECSSCNCGSLTGGSVIPVAVPAVECDYCGSGLVVYRRGGYLL